MIYTHLSACIVSVCKCASVHIYVFACITYIHLCVCINISLHICMYVVYVYFCIYKCVFDWAWSFIYMLEHYVALKRHREPGEAAHTCNHSFMAGAHVKGRGHRTDRKPGDAGDRGSITCSHVNYLGSCKNYVNPF